MTPEERQKRPGQLTPRGEAWTAGHYVSENTEARCDESTEKRKRVMADFARRYEVEREPHQGHAAPDPSRATPKVYREIRASKARREARAREAARQQYLATHEVVTLPPPVKRGQLSVTEMLDRYWNKKYVGDW